LVSPSDRRGISWGRVLSFAAIYGMADPDPYNDHLLGLLKFAKPQAFKAVEGYETALSSQEINSYAV